MRRRVPVWVVGAVSAVLAIVVVVAVVVVRGGQEPAVGTRADATVAAVGPSPGEARVTAAAEGPPPLVRASVSAHGATLRNRDGVVVEIPAGALPEGATIEIGLAPTPTLPEGVAPIGRFYKITTSAALTGLATLRLPIPVGPDAGDVALYQLRPGGELVAFGGRREAGAFVAELAAFTDEGLGSGSHLRVSLRSSSRIEAIPVSGFAGAVYAETGVVTEFTAIVEGGSGSYDFEFSYDTESVASASTETIGRGGDEQTLYLVYDELRPVPDILAVTVVDRQTGRRAEVILAVDIVAPALDITQFDIPSGPSFNSDSGRLTAGFRVCVIGGEQSPYRISVEMPDAAIITSDISTRNAEPALKPVCETLTHEFAFEPGLPITAVASVTDAAGRGPVSTSMFLQTPLLLDVEIRGPAKVTVRDAAGFVAVTTGGKPTYRHTWYAQPPDADSTLVASDVSDLQHAFDKPGIYTVTVFVSDDTRAEASADFSVEVTGAMAVAIVASPDTDPLTVGQPVTLAADVSGAAEDARLRYVWGLPDGDVATDVPTVVTTPVQAGIVAVGVTVFDEQNDEEAEAILDLDVHEPLQLAVTSIPDVINESEAAAIGLSVTGGVGSDGAVPEYALMVNYGDGSTEEFVLTGPDVLIEHTYAESGTYTVTVVATSPDGQTVTEAVELGVSGSFTLILTRPLPENFVVLANEVVIEVEGRTARVVAFGYQTEWAGFEGFFIDSSGNSQTFLADCVRHTTIENLGDDLVYAPETERITGTINLLWTRLDVGPECPFDGLDDVQTRVADVEISVVDGLGSGRFLSEEALPSFSYVLAPKTN